MSALNPDLGAGGSNSMTGLRRTIASLAAGCLVALSLNVVTGSTAAAAPFGYAQLNSIQKRLASGLLTSELGGAQAAARAAGAARPVKGTPGGSAAGGACRPVQGGQGDLHRPLRQRRQGQPELPEHHRPRPAGPGAG